MYSFSPVSSLYVTAKLKHSIKQTRPCLNADPSDEPVNGQRPFTIAGYDN